MSVDEDIDGLEDEQPEGEEQQEIEKEARALGWRPEAEFRGDKAHWVDAATFVEKGKFVVPILRENNKRLQQELKSRDLKINTLEETLTNATQALERLESHYTAANKRAVEVAKNQLKEELKEARATDDIEAEFKILDRLEELKDVVETEKPAPKQKTLEENLSPEFKKWQAENTWFGEDKKKTKAILRIAEDLRDEGDKSQGADFFERCMEVLEQQEDVPQRPASKVENGSSRSSRSSGGKSFDSLPSDARQACMEDVDALVGPTKRFKTVEDWKKKYAEIYWSENQ